MNTKRRFCFVIFACFICSSCATPGSGLNWHTTTHTSAPAHVTVTDTLPEGAVVVGGELINLRGEIYEGIAIKNYITWGFLPKRVSGVEQINVGLCSGVIRDTTTGELLHVLIVVISTNWVAFDTDGSSISFRTFL